MKKLLILLIITSLFGCKKEETPTLSGEWKLVKACDVYGCTSIDPAYSFNIRFCDDGELKVSDSNNQFREFDHYEITDVETVRFFNSTGDFLPDAHFSFESGLHLWFLNTRCGDDQ